MGALLGIGTNKGLFLARSRDRTSWEITGPHFPMTAVYSLAIDARKQPPRLLAGVTSSHFGPSVSTSDDLGASWAEPESAPIAFPSETGAALERVWQLAPGPADQPDVLYAGVEPSALFRSTDGGRSFELVRGLWDHPHRERWEPGGGGQAIHTVLTFPGEPERMLVAMSTGGVYSSDDSGETWAPSNRGIRAYFFPDDQYPEFGQCVHKVASAGGDARRLYAQNHHGVYRSDDGGGSWNSIADGLPSDFGFPIVAHPHRPDVVYTYPVAADARRFPTEERCRVFRSEDAGASWSASTDGLPQGPYYAIVLRDAMCADDADQAGIYFGTRNGEVYASPDEGDSWHLVAAHLPDVLCVRAATID